MSFSMRITLAFALVSAVRFADLTAIAWGATPLDEEFVVNTYTTERQGSPQVASDRLGNFVVVWESGYADRHGADGSYAGISARRFAAQGQPLGPEFVVNSYTFGAQSGASLGIAQDGGFLVTWRCCLTASSFNADEDSIAPATPSEVISQSSRPIQDLGPR
jgi:hypothetical protein